MISFGTASRCSGRNDPWTLLAAAVVGRAVADLRDGRYAWDARHFLVTRLREHGNLWGDLLGDLRPSSTQVQAAVHASEGRSRIE
jgi:hypothetical protein